MGEDNLNINTVSDRKSLKELVLNNVDQMEANLVYRLYYHLAIDMKDVLDK